MQFSSVQATGRTSEEAVAEIARNLNTQGRGTPDFIALHFAVGLDALALFRTAQTLWGGVAHGGSSCLGVMGPEGADTSGAGLGAFAIWDGDGSYGTGAADLGGDAQMAAQTATLAALEAAGRPGEVPELVWLTAAPGREEAVIAGICAAIGAETLIVGGSAADNDVSGGWAQFGPRTVHSDGVVVSVLFPSVPIASSYQSGYAPTGDHGIVTRVDDRRLFEIDHRPAASVLHEWSTGSVPQVTDTPVSILAASTLWPLGRVTREVAGVPFHLLAHPAKAYPDGSVDLFANVSLGDRLWQMTGTSDSLVTRAGRVAATARDNAETGVSAALVVYCGGCMLAVQDRMPEVAAGITEALGDVPWLGVFTFGEQGVPPDEGPKHGNLMISCTVFADAL